MAPEQGSAGLCRGICPGMWGCSAFSWEAVGNNICMLQAELACPDQFHIKYSQCLSIPALLLWVSTPGGTDHTPAVLFLLTTSMSVFEFLCPCTPPQHT